MVLVSRGFTNLFVRRVRGKGLGVFFGAAAPRKGDTVFIDPILILRESEVSAPLWKYVYEWETGRRKSYALCLGYGSLLNHAVEPNLIYNAKRFNNVRGNFIAFKAARDIDSAEELTINYNGEPGNNAPVDFRVLP